MNGMNEKIQESHGCKRQHRLQKQGGKTTILDCDTKEKRERSLKLRKHISTSNLLRKLRNELQCHA